MADNEDFGFESFQPGFLKFDDDEEAEVEGNIKGGSAVARNNGDSSSQNDLKKRDNYTGGEDADQNGGERGGAFFEQGDDDDDEFLSQINEEEFINIQQHDERGQKRRGQEYEDGQGRRSPPQTSGDTGYESGSSHSFNMMGPPASAKVPKLQRQPLPPRNPCSSTSTSNHRDCSGSPGNFTPVTPSSLREAFFANWDKEGLLGDDERYTKVVRRFPGPAGLLPILNETETRCLNDADHPISQQISKIIATDLTRQKYGDGGSHGHHNVTSAAKLATLTHQEKELLRMRKEPWKELVNALNLNPKDPQGILTLMNIKWVRKKLSRLSAATKVPFLALVVQEEPEILGSRRGGGGGISNKRKNPSVKLMDVTGSIIAALDASFVDSHGMELSPGTGIAVKNVSFLRFKRQLILTITKKNVICVTSLKRPPESNGEKKLKFTASEEDHQRRCKLDECGGNENVPKVCETNGGVRILKFTEFDKEEILRSYEGIINSSSSSENREAEHQIPRRPPPPPPGLFSTFKQYYTANNQETSSPLLRGTEGGGSLGNYSSSNSINTEDFSSMFGDDDDEELLQALDAVDFMLDEES